MVAVDRKRVPFLERAMTPMPLTAEQEAQAQALASRLQAAAHSDLLELARLLVSKPEHQLFGQTEFEVRDRVHRLGAKAYELHLAGKKTAIPAPGLTVPPAARPRASTTTARKPR